MKKAKTCHNQCKGGPIWRKGGKKGEGGLAAVVYKSASTPLLSRIALHFA
jgi:hypothetical protein